MMNDGAGMATDIQPDFHARNEGAAIMCPNYCENQIEEEHDNLSGI